VAIYTTTATGAQDGNTTILGVWDGAAAAIAFNSLTPTGIQFAVHTAFDSEGRPLDPVLVYPSFVLTLTGTGNPGVDSTITTSFVPETAPEPYSTTLAPGSRNEVELAETVWPAAATSLEITVPTILMFEYLKNSAWNGIISLSFATVGNVLFSPVVHSAEAADPTLAPSINTTEVAFHTGQLEGPAFGRRARLRHGPRTGMPLASDQLVRDGYVEGMMVSPEGWEPEDPEDKYVPNPLEGVLDDET